MKLRTVALLLAVWCVGDRARGRGPTAFDVEVNSDSEPSGWVLLAWIAGYLLQFGVFMVVAVKASANGMLGWLIASLVPWSANWAATVSMWWLLPCAAVIVGYSGLAVSEAARGHALQRPDLHRRGDLTDVEFAAAKRRVLALRSRSAGSPAVAAGRPAGRRRPERGMRSAT